MPNRRPRFLRHLGRVLVALGASGLLLASTAASAGGGFSAPHYFPVLGPRVFPVAVADFNRDGRRDIVVGADTANGMLSILYGKKGGGFKPYADFPGGSNPFAISTADFNHDRRPDLAVAEESSSGGVGVMLSKHGGFGPLKTYKTGSDVYSIAIADFNHDGNPDIAAANYGDNSISVLLGRSNGTFKHRKTRPTDHYPSSIVAGDFNHDGKQDVAVLDYRSGTNADVQVFLGTGNGKFKAPKRYAVGASDPDGFVAGQFTADHNLDLAVPSCDGPGQNKVFLLDGTSKGTFEKPRGFANDPGSCSFQSGTGDLNRDGRTDLVTAISAGANSGDVSVLYGKKGGKLSGPHLYAATTDQNYSVTVAGINGDKRPDLVVPDYLGTPQQVGVLYGTG